MKKTSFTLIIALMAVAVLFTGCKKEELNGNGRKVTLGVRMDPSNAKTYIDGVTPKWHANDQVKVNNGTYGVTGVDGNKAQIENVDEADNYRVVFPASIVTSDDISSTVNVTLPAVQTYTEVNGVQRVDAPMGGYGGPSTDLSMHNLCSILKVNVTNTRNTPMTLRKITVTAESANLSGTGTATVEGLTTDKITLTSGSKSVSLVFGGTEVIVPALGGKTFYIVAPEFNQQDVTIKVFEADGLSKKSYSNVALEHNMITSVSVNNTNIIEGVLPGEFTVANGRKIYFSKGNLQYNKTTQQFSFMDNQWSTVETLNQNVGTNYASTNIVSLFGWGAWRTGNTPSNTDGRGYSWGNGEPIADWYTLSQAEWAWLLGPNTDPNPGTNCRTSSTVNGTDNARFAKANLFGTTHGLIIFPDSYTHPEGVRTPLTGINASGSTSWDANQFTTAEWAQMEAAGCVFLPAAGLRYGTVVNFVGFNGSYWSSTPEPDDEDYACYVGFGDYYLSADGGNRNVGMLVRLVQDAN